MFGFSVLDVSVISPLLIETLGVAAFAALAVAIAVPTRRWWTHTVPLVVVGTTAALAVASYAADLERRFNSPFPHSFYVWAWLPLCALVLTVATWRHAVVWRRVTRIVSVVLLTAFGASLINLQYGYLPDVRAVLGLPQPEEITRADLSARRLRGHNEGALVRLDLPSPTARFHHRAAVVWLPRAWFHGHPTLPVIVLLGGTPGNPVDLVQAGHVDDVIASYARAHNGSAPIVVLPDDNGSFFGDTECVNGPRGNAETYLAVDVPRFVRARFGASSNPDQWAVGGISEGGTCALVLALRHPDVYRHVLDISGDPYPNLGIGRDGELRATRGLYGGDASQWPAHDPVALMAGHRFMGDSAWFAAGRQDHARLRTARMLAAAASSACIATKMSSSPGGHSYLYFSVALRDALPWLADQVTQPQAHPAGVRASCA